MVFFPIKISFVIDKFVNENYLLLYLTSNWQRIFRNEGPSVQHWLEGDGRVWLDVLREGLQYCQEKVNKKKMMKIMDEERRIWKCDKWWWFWSVIHYYVFLIHFWESAQCDSQRIEYMIQLKWWWWGSDHPAPSFVHHLILTPSMIPFFSRSLLFNVDPLEMLSLTSSILPLLWPRASSNLSQTSK